VLEEQLVLTMRLLLREENPSNSRSRAKDSASRCSYVLSRPILRLEG
jgi:hypothetical protein